MVQTATATGCLRRQTILFKTHATFHAASLVGPSQRIAGHDAVPRQSPSLALFLLYKGSVWRNIVFVIGMPKKSKKKVHHRL